MLYGKATRLGDVLNEYLRQSGLDERLREVEVCRAWDEVVGPQAAGATTSREVKDGVLTCRINSSMVRSQLFMQRDTIRNRINIKLGREAVKQLILR